ncbi:MAG: hypothetical protein M1839_002053 [Geoglossum umbratile]|nr:MAG: hypothetical protein M1839_002053 [Geoglossum umbratile]
MDHLIGYDPTLMYIKTSSIPFEYSSFLTYSYVLHLGTQTMENFSPPALPLSLHQSSSPFYADSRSALEYIRALSACQVAPERNETFHVRPKEYDELVLEIEKDPVLNSYFTSKLQ